MYRQRKYINYLLKTNFCTELTQKSVKKQLFDRFFIETRYNYKKYITTFVPC